MFRRTVGFREIIIRVLELDPFHLQLLQPCNLCSRRSVFKLALFIVAHVYMVMILVQFQRICYVSYLLYKSVVDMQSELVERPACKKFGMLVLDIIN
jgi:hypothetical protein